MSFFAKFKELFALFALNIKIKLWNLSEFCIVLFRFYRNGSFAAADLSLLSKYLFKNPYKMSKYFLQNKGEKEIYAYGETPLTTLEKIASECEFSDKDTVFELGCGRGRTCFWLHSFVGCRVVGIEFIPEFVKYANSVKESHKIQGLEFRLGDFLKQDYSQSTVCYLYGSCLPDESIEGLILSFKNLKKGAKVITVSYPLTDYKGGYAFQVVKTFEVAFPWGMGDIFLQEKL